jgi:hypothetical protein
MIIPDERRVSYASHTISISLQKAVERIDGFREMARGDGGIKSSLE